MREGLERQRGADLEGSVRFVLVEFVGRVERGHPVVWPPDFLPPGRGPVEVIEVGVDSAVEATLRREAERLGTSADQLAGHAVLVSLAAHEALESSLATS